MVRSKNTMAFSLVICAAVVGAKSAQAGGYHFGGGSGNGGGSNNSFKINHGGNNSSHNQFKNGSPFSKFWNSKHHNLHDHHGHHHLHHKYRVRYVQPVYYVYNKCYHPDFRCCYVYPGDNWYSISKRVYGVDYLGRHIASYNRLSMKSPLAVGQMLRLPVVNANGTLATSTAPMPAPFGSRPAGLTPTATAVSSANTRTVNKTASLPRVAVGSTLALSGESLGETPGTVRLQFNGVTLPVEVIEWTSRSVKAQLPKLEMSRPIKASLEVMRADGSMASSSPIELSPAATRVALGK